MKNSYWIAKIILAIILFILSIRISQSQDLPSIKGKKAVAKVNGEVISLDEFNQELKKTGEKDRSNLLRRLINARLIIQEAKNMGLGELKEIKNLIDVFSKITLREELMERVTRDVKASEQEVDKIYKEYIKEWKISSLIFNKEEDARSMEELLKKGKSFDELFNKFVTEGKAKLGDKGNYLKAKDIYPQVVEVVSRLKKGAVSPVIPLKSGFIILRLEDIRFIDNPEEKDRAEKEALKNKIFQTLKDYNTRLIKRYAKVNHDVLDRIDFESKNPGFEALLKDKTVIADIKGEKPITVGELTQYIKQQFYHGVKMAIENKKLNEKKIPVFEEILYKRVFRKEALRLGLDKTESYNNKIKEYEDSVLFGAFIKKVIQPDIKIKEEELKSYYQKHIKEYTFPEMMRIDNIIFKNRKDAELAIERLRKGADFKWVSNQAEGKIDRNTLGVLNFDGRLLTTKDLPDGIRKAIVGARPGDFRLYVSPEGYFYVLAISEVVPSKPMPFEEVKEKVSRKVFDEKVKKALEEYADKLKAVSDIEIYLKEN